MTPDLVVRDLAAWSLQVALLIGVGALLARLLPLRPPAFALAYWQTLLLACLALPLAQPWHAPQRAAVAVPVVTTPSAAAAAPASVAPVAELLPSATLVLAIVAAGMAIRGVWLAVGLWMLRGLRRRARPLPGPQPAVESAQSALAVAAEFFSSQETQAPITFGLRRPAVLLPESFLGMAPEAQRAIACHELLHVRRCDWLWAMLEECVRAMLWFHPAVAWLVSRVQLVREQAVDRAVIALTDSREEYLGALLAVAQAKAQPQLVPASLFLRKGRLKQRVAEILREGSMSRKRLVLHLLVSGCAILLSAATAVTLFPLQAARAAEEGPVQLLKGGENLLHRAPVEYPKRAFEKGVAGDVLLSLSLDERGQVQDARVVSGPDELRAAALRSVLRWHYSPSAAPGTIDVLLHFRLPEKGERVAEEAEHKQPHPPIEHIGRQIEELQKALDDPAVSGERREKYEHQLRERHEQLERLQHGLRELESSRFEYAPGREADMRTMRAKLAAEQHAHERLLEKMARALAVEQELERRRVDEQARDLAEEQGRQERARGIEYAKAARESAEQEARFKLELDERKRKELAARQLETKLLEARESRPVTTYTAERGTSTHRYSLPGRLSAIHGARLGPEALQALLPQLGVKVGDTLDAAAFERAKAAVAAFDEHITVELGRAPEDGGLILLLVGPQP